VTGFSQLGFDQQISSAQRIQYTLPTKILFGIPVFRHSGLPLVEMFNHNQRSAESLLEAVIEA